MTEVYQPVVIGFGHKARQGKGTVVETIVDAYKGEYDVRAYGFGDELKAEVNQFDQLEFCLRNGIQYDYDRPMTDPLCQTEHGKQSRLLQFWGDYMRQRDNFYWVKKLGASISKDRPRIALIHDVRYKNEFAFVKAMGGFMVRVQRLGYTDLSRDARHISEVDLDNVKFDIEITVNDGEIEQLKNDAITVFNLVLAQYQPKEEELPGVIVQEAV